MNKRYISIDDYISDFPADVQEILVGIREVIKESAPAARETIDYGIPTFRLNGKNLVHFAAYKKHIGFYPTPSAVEAFEKDLSPYDTSKGTVKFPLDGAIPLDLINRMVIFRVSELNM